MVDIATPFYAALQRTMNNLTDIIAKEGLNALKRTLDRAKFAKSEHLKNYEVFAHVLGTEIEFEIVLDIEAVEPADEITRHAMEEGKATEEEILRKELTKTYGWHIRGPRRLKDIRKSAGDIRAPIESARKTSKHRLMEHEIILRNPRSAEVTPEGKLSVSLRRSMRETDKEVRMPQKEFQGIIGQFMTELHGVITDNFTAELQKIISRYVK